VFTQEKVIYADPPADINDILTVRPAIRPHSKQRNYCSYEPFKYLHQMPDWLQHKTAFQKLKSFFNGFFHKRNKSGFLNQHIVSPLTSAALEPDDKLG